MRKQQQGKEAKQGLVRGAVAFVTGKENINLPKRQKAADIPGDGKEAFKSTKYRHAQVGAAVINGASKLLNWSEKSRAEAMRASLKTKLAPANPKPATNTNDAVAAEISKQLDSIKAEQKNATTRTMMCSSFVEAMKSHNTPGARRPFLACFCGSKKPDVEQLADTKISDYEFNKAKLHARWPGPLKQEPKIDRCRQRVNRAVDLAAAPGGLMMVGTHKDRKKQLGASVKEFDSVAEMSPAAVDCCCFMAFHRKDEESESSYHKTPKLQLELDRLFALRPKVSAEQAREMMLKQVDPADGGLMFCYAKRGTYMPRTGKHKQAYDAWVGCSMCHSKPCVCNGMLLTVDQITSAFTTRAKTARKRGDAEEHLDYSTAQGRVDIR